MVEVEWKQNEIQFTFSYWNTPNVMHFKHFHQYYYMHPRSVLILCLWRLHASMHVWHIAHNAHCTSHLKPLQFQSYADFDNNIWESSKKKTNFICRMGAFSRSSTLRDVFPGQQTTVILKFLFLFALFKCYCNGIHKVIIFFWWRWLIQTFNIYAWKVSQSILSWYHKYDIIPCGYLKNQQNYDLDSAKNLFYSNAKRSFLCQHWCNIILRNQHFDDFHQGE